MSVLNRIPSDKDKSHAAHMGPLGSWVTFSQMYRILTLLSSFGWDFFLLTEGSILRDLGVTLLIIIAMPLD